MNNDLNSLRYNELSQKLFKLGESLANEGREIEDYTITTTGNLMVFIAGLMYDEDDLYFISEIVSMFSTKKVIDFEFDGQELDMNKIAKFLIKKYKK